MAAITWTHAVGDEFEEQQIGEPTRHQINGRNGPRLIEVCAFTTPRGVRWRWREAEVDYTNCGGGAADFAAVEDSWRGNAKTKEELI
jgi:hypothetical protein